MSSWMNEAAVQNPNGNGFPHINDANATGPMGVGVSPGIMDPSTFMAGNAQFNPNELSGSQQQQQQQMMAMQQNMLNLQNASNGTMRNASPSAFQNPMYQTNSVIPSKRPRPHEDSAAASPRPNSSMLPSSRSGTPQQTQFPSFPPSTLPQQQQTTPQPSYPHLPPDGSANATPSPILANQIRSGSVPQRVSTASPHAFSPATQGFVAQGSPAPSEQSPAPQQQSSFSQPNNFAPGFNPSSFTPGLSTVRPSPNTTQAGGQMAPMSTMGQMNAMAQAGQVPPSQMLTPQMQQQLAQARNPVEQQKLMYQMQLQRQLQQSNMQAAAQMQGANGPVQQRNMMARQQQQPQQQSPSNGQPAPGIPGAGKPSMQSSVTLTGSRFTPEQFVQQLSVFMSRRNLPLDPNPVVGDRPVHLMVLFQAVQKSKGYRHVTQTNGWPQVCHVLGYPSAQLPTVAGQMRAVYERNLLKFAEFWSQNRAKMAHQQQQQQHQQQQSSTQPQGAPHTHQQPHEQEDTVPVPGSPKATTNVHSPSQLSQAQNVGQNSQQQPPTNGIPTANPSNAQQQLDSSHAAPRNSVQKTNSSAAPPENLNVDTHSVKEEGDVQPNGLSHTEGSADEYKPCSRESHTYGGVDIHAPTKVVSDILRFRPDIPAPQELGNIDIHALTKSLQSGIKSEVRLALDTLATVTMSNIPGLDIELDKCDDLLDSLVEYAEEVVEIIAEHTVEVSDEILIPPYEDIARACQIERLSLRDDPEVGSEEEELKTAIDHLLCVTTILRNLSFNLRNQVCLADECTVRFLFQVIRYAGTRNMFLRTQLNMLDFMKDVIVLLSNISGCIEIPGCDETFCFLQFLLAFAPAPAPSLTDAHIFFPAFQPLLHPYLPPAVDALAKLLARDEPNRTHFRNVFATDTGGIAPSDLLTKTFALAISPIPEHFREVRPRHLLSIMEARKPILMQGLLAADIVASLAPGYESGVTRAWLNADNGFAQNLQRSVRDLCRQFESVEIHARQYRMREPPRKDAELMYIVVLAISMLRKLSEKALDPSDPEMSHPPWGVLPSEEGLLEALEMISGEWSRDGFLRNLVAFASLGN